MITHEVSGQLGMPGIHDECDAIARLRDADHYTINVAAIQHFEPIAMLLLGSALRELQQRDDGKVHVEFVGRDDIQRQGHAYAARMGFWWSIGEDPEPPIRSTNPSGATIPITRVLYSDLFRQSGGRDPVRSGLVSKAAAQAATSLCGSDKPSPLWDALEYSLREMFRNTFEHSRSDAIWYTASTRPRKDDVQLAIADQGCGIRKSLQDSGLYEFRDDAEAIERALRPGVSRNERRQRSEEELNRIREEFPGQDPTEWDNSGYGLTLTTELCRHAGQYTVVSGNASVSYNRASIVSFASHKGTALRFVLQPSRIEQALKEVGLDGAPKRSGRSSQSLLTASQRFRLQRKGFDSSAGD